MDQNIPQDKEQFDSKTEKYIEKNIQQNSTRNLEKPYRFSCMKCGQCCKDKNTIVNLTFMDILRIQQYLELTLSELLDVIGFYVFEHEPTTDQLKKLVVPPIRTQRGLAIVGLKKDTSGKCIYLDEVNLCKIYEARPNICRTFPFYFHSVPKKEPKPHLDIDMAYATKAIEYCPGIGNASPIIKPKNWLEIGEQTIKDILAENVLIKKWNEAVIEKKITPIAENYIQTILAMKEKPKKNDSSKSKKSYQQIAKKKLMDQKKQH